MAVFKCKMCGEPLDLSLAVSGTCKCNICNTYQTISIPVSTSEKIEALYGSASHFRRNNEFDIAISVYQQILAEDSEDPEAYWGVVLCRYGIEYVKDPKTKNMIPTVNRTQLKPIFNDSDYILALKYATEAQRTIYEREAGAIDEIQRGILEISSREEPFDVFICYKETDRDGKRTEDSVIAQQIYKELTRDGIKVFFARITLEDKLGSAYEPYIFGALSSARVMLVIGTSCENLNSAWVKNEWSRYLNLINQGQKKTLIPAYKYIDAYELPRELLSLQGQDLGALGGVDNLILATEKLVGNKKSERDITLELLERAYDNLELGDFVGAVSIADKVIEADFKCAEAYVVRLLAEFKACNKEALAECSELIGESFDYKRAMKYGDEGLKSFLADSEAKSRVRCEKQRELEAKLAEERRIEEEKRLAEERRIEEEKRLAEERQRAADATTIKAPTTGARVEEPTISRDGTLRLPYGTTIIKDNQFSNNEKIVYVEIPDTVEEIGDGAFEGCCNLVSVTIPSSVNYLGSNALSHCGLRTVNIPGSIRKIGDYAFEGCNSLTSATLGEGVIEIGEGAFEGCGLKSISLPTTLTTISTKSFEGCSFESLSLPDGVTDIGNYSFYGCTNLTSLTLGAGVRRIGPHAFMGCKRLERLSINSSLEEIGIMAFADTGIKKIALSANAPYSFVNGCLLGENGSRLLMYAYGIKSASLVIPEGVTTIDDGIFSDCKFITSIEFPEGVVKIGERAFNGVEISRLKLPSTLQSIGKNAFFSCNRLTSVELPCGLCQLGDSVFPRASIREYTTHPDNQAFSAVDGVLYSRDGSVLIEYPAGRECSEFVVPIGVTEIKSNAFWCCKGLVDIMLPSTLKKIGSSAFSNCVSLKSVHIPLSVEYIGDYAFSGCPSLAIRCEAEKKPRGWCPNWRQGNRNTQWGVKIETLSEPFSIDENGTLTIKSGVSVIAQSQFAFNKGIKKIVIPEGVTKIEYWAFWGCENVEEIYLPASLTEIGDRVFEKCYKLKSIHVSSASKHFKVLDNALYSYDLTHLYKYCTADPRASLSIREYVKHIECGALTDAFNLKYIYLHEGIVSLANYCFWGCYGITSIVIPKSVTYVGDRAFCQCTALKEIKCVNASEPSSWHKEWCADTSAEIKWGYVSGFGSDFGNFDI